MNYVTVIPAVRVSSEVAPEIRVFSDEADGLQLNIVRDGAVLRQEEHTLSPGNTLSFACCLKGLAGPVELHLLFLKGGSIAEEKVLPYEIVNSGIPATRLIDGCWISICHWSDDEARFFNPDLKKMKDVDFERHIEDMAAVGIRGVVIQNLFDSEHYVGRHQMTCETYDGAAFYPSKLYSRRIDLAAEDPVEAVLSAADRCGMHVLLGIGLFAWFDFSEESLRWHKHVAEEVYRMYGHHPSFYGWYVSEEIMGDLYESYMPLHRQRWKELPRFFRELGKYLRTLDPVRPIAFAPNNIRFQENREKWEKILPYIDILLPFAFARDLEHFNVREIRDICDTCHTHMWVDMEMFQNPFDDGLVPKPIDELVREIRLYDSLEQCYGYQYTGLMNHPDCPFSLGGEKAKQLYRDYSAYHKKITESGN